MLFSNIFDAKIVHGEAETNRASVMCPQSRGCGALAIAMLCQALFQQLLGNDTGLWQAVHSLSYFAVDGSVRSGKFAELVMIDNVFGHICESEAHVFVASHRGVQIKILDVHCHESRVLS